ncbi:MAG TPA: class I SAM-dependent methyltransferase [Cryomorphaceae bacterium]|nr:class I SAM-dependent methyltransferase [Cryomorphaceae bacterium]
MIYDEVYLKNPGYFGNPFPEVIDYFARQKDKGKVLDVGCGQGRNAIPLAEMGCRVHAIDTSSIAVSQLKARIYSMKLDLKVEQRDFSAMAKLNGFDFILLDGFFHFYDHELADEANKMRHLLSNVDTNCKLVFCFADHGDSVSTFREMTAKCAVLEEIYLRYAYVDPVSKWKFETDYYFAVVNNKG